MPPTLRRLALFFWLASHLSLQIGLAADAPHQPTEDNRPSFLRLTRDPAGEPQAMETAIVRYATTPRAGQPPVEVDLVAAVHIGSKAYFATLNHLFRDYDAVLYELVAPPNARVPQPGGRPSGAIGTAQQGMTKLLGLTFQLNEVDYKAPNFIHADLSPQQFAEAMQRRGESWWTMFAKLMQESIARADANDSPADDAADVSFGDLFGLLFGSNRELRLRRILAEQFSDMEVLTAAFGGENGSSLITDRNAAALHVLQRQIQRGSRSIAIFYGAAHMDDFDQHLQNDFGLVPQETAWLEAWDLRAPSP